MCVCVEFLNRSKTFTVASFSAFWWGPMGTWMAWANKDPSKLLCVPAIVESWWDVTNPRTTMPFFNENHFRIWIRHMNGWRWLLIYLSAPLVQSETAVNFLSIPFFCLYCRILRGFFWFYSFLQGGDEGIFLPLHTKPSCQVSRMKWSFCTTDAFHIKIR